MRKRLLITDLDGTLLTDDKQISKRNMEAIKRFIAEGGYFTVATGRGTQMSNRIVKELLGLKVPAVILNGGAVYDYKTNEYLWYTCLGDDARDCAKLILKEFPEVGMEILHPNGIYIPNRNKETQLHMDWENLNPIYCTFEELPKKDWLKLLLACDKTMMEEVMRFVFEHCGEAGHWVHSADIFFELLPEGANKGSGLTKLLELTEQKDAFVVAVGDYNNDIEMLEVADCGVAVQNAQDAVKIKADRIVTDNNHDAIAMVIEKLKEWE